jgi:glycerol-3-phosphate dehydrogenase
MGRTCVLSEVRVLEQLPGINPANLSGGVRYEDGQFDDARLIISLFRTLMAQGGLAINHTRVARLIKENSRVVGVMSQDQIGQQEWEIRARVVINATGIFGDEIRRMDVADELLE